MMIELVTEHLKLSDVLIGYPILMAEVMEEAADELLKKPSTPWRSKSEIPFVRKYFIQDKIETKGLEPGQIRHWISTAAIDRDGEIMVPRGMDAKHYKKNPIVFWGHNYSEPENTIAKNLSLMVNEKGIMALTQFAKHNKASMIHDLYAGDFLRAWSIGFIPVKGKRPAELEKPEVPEGMVVIDFSMPKPGDLRYTHEKWILLEYSAVGVPANPEALTEEVAKGNIELSDRVLEEMQFKLEEINLKKKEHGWREKSYVFYEKGKDEKEKQTVEGEAPAEAKAEGKEEGVIGNEWHDHSKCGGDEGVIPEVAKEEPVIEVKPLSRKDVRAIVRDVIKEVDEELKQRGPEFILLKDINLTPEAVVTIAPEPILNLDKLFINGVEEEVPAAETTSVTVTKEQLAAVVKDGLKALDEAGFKVILKNSVDMVIGRG